MFCRIPLKPSCSLTGSCRVEIRRRVHEYSVYRDRQSTQRTDRRQNQKDEQQSVLGQVLSFFFLPQPYQEAFHSVLSGCLFEPRLADLRALQTSGMIPKQGSTGERGLAMRPVAPLIRDHT